LRGKPFYKTGKYGNVLNLNFWTPFWGNMFQKLPNHLDLSEFLVVAHMPSGILFADRLGVPFVAGVHNSDLEVLTNPLYKFHFKKRLKTALQNAKAIACRSFVIEKKLLKLFPEFNGKTFVAPSGIAQSDNFDENIQSPENSEISVLTCANFKKRKNIDKLINACKGKYKLTVIGDGKLRKSLEKLDNNVQFLGWLNHDEVLTQMKNHDVFVLPSVGETFGMVYLEAMSQGCITVCTKDDGIDGIIKDGENGFLTLPNSQDIKNTLDRINSMSQNERKALIYKGFDTIKTLTPEICANNYLQQIIKFL
jgi:glycosyltransferase involved in cell wall biosynthesis